MKNKIIQIIEVNEDYWKFSELNLFWYFYNGLYSQTTAYDLDKNVKVDIKYN